MKLPEIKNADKYVGLYVVDFGENSGIGFTAGEVAELLDSERFGDVKVYKIYKAYPDGRMELKGIRAEIFQLEMGMFFYAYDIKTAKEDYRNLIGAAVGTAVPARAKVHLSRYTEDKYVTALIYPAEYNEEFSDWLKEIDYKTSGAVQGGIGAVERYYTSNYEVLEKQQLFGEDAINSRSGENLLLATKMAVQR